MKSDYNMKGYSKCGAFIGFLAINLNIINIPKECLKCPKAYSCALELNPFK